MKRLSVFMVFVALAGLLWVAQTSALAAMTCTFTTVGSTMSLDADCTTDETIPVPDGMTLDGQGNAITAEDPSGGHFVGAVVQNAGATAYVTRLVVNTSNLSNVCDGGADRLRGIMFEGASGSITHNTVQDINQGPSGCQEGNAVEVRNAPFDGTHPDTQSVEIAHNVLQDWQKTGIVCNGDVDCYIHHNMIGESATQANLAANSVQLGLGASGLVELNHIAGNQWLGASNYAATAVLLYCADGPEVRRNNIGGNADVGIYGVGADLVFCGFSGDGVIVNNNRVFESGEDGDHGDFGLIDYFGGNSFTNNKVRGYDFPAYASPDDGEISGTKVVPAPQDPGAACFLPDSSAQAC